MNGHVLLLLFRAEQTDFLCCHNKNSNWYKMFYRGAIKTKRRSYPTSKIKTTKSWCWDGQLTSGLSSTAHDLTLNAFFYVAVYNYILLYLFRLHFWLRQFRFFRSKISFLWEPTSFSSHWKPISIKLILHNKKGFLSNKSLNKLVNPFFEHYQYTCNKLKILFLRFT